MARRKKKKPLKPEEIKMLEGIIEGKSQKDAYLDAYPNSKAREPRKLASRKMKQPHMQEALDLVVKKAQEKSVRALVKLRMDAEENIEALEEIAHNESSGAANRVTALKWLGEKGLPPEQKIIRVESDLQDPRQLEAGKIYALISQATAYLLLRYMKEKKGLSVETINDIKFHGGERKNPEMAAIIETTEKFIRNDLLKGYEEGRYTKENIIGMIQDNTGYWVPESAKSKNGNEDK